MEAASAAHTSTIPAGQEALMATLREVVTRGQTVLIVGCPPGTFPEPLRRNPVLTFWPSSEPHSSDGTRIVPAAVGAVLLTPMLSHTLSRNVREQVAARHLVCPGMLPAGIVKRLLAELPHGEPQMPRPKAVTPFNPILSRPAPLPAPPPTSAPPPPPPPAAAPAQANGRPDLAAQLEDLQKLVADATRAIGEAAAGLELVKDAAAGLTQEVALVKRQAEKVRMLKELLS